MPKKKKLPRRIGRSAEFQRAKRDAKAGKSLKGAGGSIKSGVASRYKPNSGGKDTVYLVPTIQRPDKGNGLVIFGNQGRLGPSEQATDAAIRRGTAVRIGSAKPGTKKYDRLVKKADKKSREFSDKQAKRGAKAAKRSKKRGG